MFGNPVFYQFFHLKMACFFIPLCSNLPVAKEKTADTLFVILHESYFDFRFLGKRSETNSFPAVC